MSSWKSHAASAQEHARGRSTQALRRAAAHPGANLAWEGGPHNLSQLRLQGAPALSFYTAHDFQLLQCIIP